MYIIQDKISKQVIIATYDIITLNDVTKIATIENNGSILIDDSLEINHYPGETILTDYVSGLYCFDGTVWSEYLTKTQVWNEIRTVRNQKLKDSDWTQFSDVVLDPVLKQEWITYRQTLRDITSQSTNPYDIIWPLAPGEVLPGLD